MKTYLTTLLVTTCTIVANAQEAVDTIAHQELNDMRLNFRMAYIGINYNLRWGHQKQRTNKRINVAGDTDQSTAGGR